MLANEHKEEAGEIVQVMNKAVEESGEDFKKRIQLLFKKAPPLCRLVRIEFEGVIERIPFESCTQARND